MNYSVDWDGPGERDRDPTDEIERLKKLHMDASLMRDALQRESDALRSKLGRAHAMMCSASAELDAQKADEAHDILKRAIRALA